MRPRIIITDKIHKRAIEEAQSFADVELAFGISHDDLLEKIRGFDAIIVRSATKVTREIIEAGDLKIVGRAGVGLDNIDLTAANEKNISIVNSPEASTIAVAEIALGSLLCLMRNIHHAHRSMSEGRWDRSKFTGNELYSKTLGVIGFGRIGREVSDRARAFGMKVLAYDPQMTSEDARENDCEFAEVNEILQKADVVTVHVPLTARTKDLINKDNISTMKSEAVIVNIARGGIVNENDLYLALKEKKIKGAVLDVYTCEPPKDNLFAELDNVVLTPHLGASTDEAQINAGMVVVEKIKNFFREKE